MIEFDYAKALICIEIVFSLLVLSALRNAGLRTRPLLVLGLLWAVWLATVYQLLQSGFFGASGMPQLSFTLGVIIPVVIGLLVERFWRPLGQAVATVPTVNFLRLQTSRAVFGVMFFFTTELPAWFQYIGGLGDIAAGVGALLALRFLRKNPADERGAIIRGNLIGILDFVVVLNLGALVVLRNQSPDIMFDLIPLYVVPIFILLHVFSLRRLGDIAGRATAARALRA